MTRKVIVNLVVSLILFPPLILIGHWGKMLNGIYRLEDAYYPDFISFIKILLISTGYPIPSLFFFVFVLFPFQWIKDHYFNEGRQLSFWKKVRIFATILTIFMVLIILAINMVFPVWYKNLIFLAVIAGYSILIPAILYWTIDRYVEKKGSNSM